MIQPKIVETQDTPRKRMPKHGRRRRRNTRFAQYGSCARIVAALSAVLAPVMVYVMLTSNLTSMNYALAAAETQRTQMQQDLQRLDDRIAHLESRERLAQVAAKLGMRDPNRYEVVTLTPPSSERKHGGLAFLGWLRR